MTDAAPVPAPEAATAAATSVTERLISVDALRGFDMFWILGADYLVASLKEITGSENGVLGWMAVQLEHVEWEGFVFYDMIFPLFVFLMGVAITFSLDKVVEKEGKKGAYIRIVKRFVLLFLCGVLYNGGLSREWPQIRIMGVLQRIALCYLFGSLLYMNLKKRGLIIACAAILLGYWAFMSFVPVPAEPALTAIDPTFGQAGISFARGSNWANYIDYHFLPGRRYDAKSWDPEGLLSTIPAVATALLGIFAGMLLQAKDVPNQKKALYLIGAGVLAVMAGYLWGYQFPVIKKIWTSSYVLVAGGYSSILLGVFYQVIDIWKFQFWARPFIWIGSNALALYLAGRFFEFGDIAELFVGGDIKVAMGDYGPILQTIVALLFIVLFARFLYKNKIFIRL